LFLIDEFFNIVIDSNITILYVFAYQLTGVSGQKVTKLLGQKVTIYIFYPGGQKG
jgi:hypothetical protein